MFSRLLISLSLIGSCWTYSNAQETITTHNIEQSEPDRLAVISLKIVALKDQYSVVFTNSIILNTGKQMYESEKKWRGNDFVCFIIDEQKQVLDTLVIQQPLKIRYEFPQEDQTIGSKVINLLENEVLLRFPYAIIMKQLIINKCDENGNLILIDTLDLPTVK